MKKITFLMFVFIATFSCFGQTSEFASFGEEITSDNTQKVWDVLEEYQTMKVGDSINYKLTGTVNSVCQAKGCWMTLNLAEGEEIMVKFKDYGFFVPKDIAGKEVIINGKAFVNEVSVKELQHYAKDAGKSKEEIAQINTPKKTYSFEADGVLVRN